MMDHNHSQPFTFRARKSQNFMNERIIKNKHCNKISIKVSHYAFAWLKICCIWILGICMDDNSFLWPLYICDFNCFIFSWWAGMISEPILPAVEAVTHRLLFGDAAVRGCNFIGICIAGCWLECLETSRGRVGIGWSDSRAIPFGMIQCSSSWKADGDEDDDDNCAVLQEMTPIYSFMVHSRKIWKIFPSFKWPFLTVIHIDLILFSFCSFILEMIMVLGSAPASSPALQSSGEHLDEHFTPVSPSAVLSPHSIDITLAPGVISSEYVMFCVE